MAKKESALQREIKKYLQDRGWHVEVFTCGAFQKGIPDLYVYKNVTPPGCSAPIEEYHRWVDIKRPKGGTLTKAQAAKWPLWESIGLGVWIMTECNDEVLYGPPNFRDWWKPRYDKYQIQSGASILENWED